MPTETLNFKNYSWVFPAATFGYDLLCGYALDKKPEYLETALQNLSYSFGTNPSGYFLQTGLGFKRNIEVVDNESTWDNLIEPVPGLPLGIGSAGFYWLSRYENTVAEGQYPIEWPLMNRWYDGFNVNSEFTIEILIREALVTGYFSSPGNTTPQPPKVKIALTNLPIATSLVKQFKAEITNPGGRIREYFWDFNDESFSTAAAPEHAFSEAGREYSVAVTITDENGLQAYDVVRVAFPDAISNRPHAEFMPDAQTLALYHFNGDFNDSSGNDLNLSTKKGNAERQPFQFTKLTPLWMEKPSGNALDMDGQEQFIVTIPATKLPAPATPITIEMMLYLRDFAGWGFEGNPTLLGLTRDWDDWLGWKQETWDKKSAPFFGSGTSKILTSDKFADDFPRHRWNHVKIVDNGAGQAQFFINGTLMGAAAHKPLMGNKRGDLSFSLGPFRGLVDEVRISTTAR